MESPEMLGPSKQHVDSASGTDRCPKHPKYRGLRCPKPTGWRAPSADNGGIASPVYCDLCLTMWSNNKTAGIKEKRNRRTRQQLAEARRSAASA